MAAADIICRAKASYKKIPGILELSSTHLQWSQEGKTGASLKVPYVQAASLFCSKEGAAQVRLKLGVVGDEQGHNFTFIAPPPAALHDREIFKRELSSIISRNRATLENGSGGPNTVAPAFSKHPPPSAHGAFPRPPLLTPPHGSMPGSRASSTPPAGGPDDFRLRKKVLMKNDDLAALHYELVVGGQITESEFWDGRETLLLAEASVERQKRGKPGQIIDPRPTDQSSGERKIVVTPQMVHDIFEEHPVVAKAYNENVPNELSEGEFWKRYFQSKLFDNHRASIRSTAAQSSVKEDPIFDKYLEKEDNELEPRKRRNESVDLLVDLGATAEDHPETGNEKDATMQAGKQRGALPLIRRFNEHSERLLKSALGNAPAAKRRRLDSDSDATSRYESIDLDDLHDPSASPVIALEMKDRQRYFEGRTAIDVTNGDHASVDFKDALNEVRESSKAWRQHLGAMKLEKKAADTALETMTRNVSVRSEIKKNATEFPETLLRQMKTCQTAGNEFLRQFWGAIFPASDTQTLANASAAHRAAKVDRMADYLLRTPAKVDALVHTAREDGVDPIKVLVALQPLLDAVEKALQYYRTRKPPR